MSMSKRIMLDPGFRSFVPAGTGNAAVLAREEKQQQPDLEAIKKQAFADGQASARNEVAALRDRQAEFLQRLSVELDEYFGNLERYLNEQTAEMALALAEVILRHALPDRDMMKNVLKEVVGRISDSENVKIRANPEDMALLKDGLTEADMGPVAGRVDFVPDSTLGSGDMLVENGFGCYDATIKARTEIMREELKVKLGKTYAN